MVEKPKGRVLRVIFLPKIDYAEVQRICSPYGSLRQFSRKENSYLIYLDQDMGIDKIDRLITRLRKLDAKVRDVIFMS